MSTRTAQPAALWFVAAQVSAAVALGVAIVVLWVLARRAPYLMVGVLLALTLVMGWVVRPLAWKHAPADVLLSLSRGKIWVAWLALSAMGMALVAAVGWLARSRRGAPA
jgi:hypothetical protein